MTELFDTHAHLLDERFDTDRDAIVSRLKGSGVTLVMEACCDAEGIAKTVDFARAHDFIYGSVGVHPHSASEMSLAVMDELRLASKEAKIRAIGEIGLDYHYDFSPRDLQKRWFAEQLDLAAELKLPVIIHDREAHGDCLEMVRARKGRISGVMHCFSGSYESAKILIDCGLFIGFGGALTFKNAVNQKDIAARLPIERIVIETDCPYMTPVPYRGKRNDPTFMHLTLEALASARGTDPEALAPKLYENGRTLFNI